jgi:hypothetical protein
LSGLFFSPFLFAGYPVHGWRTNTFYTQEGRGRWIKKPEVEETKLFSRLEREEIIGIMSKNQSRLIIIWFIKKIKTLDDKKLIFFP